MKSYSIEIFLYFRAIPSVRKKLIPVIQMSSGFVFLLNKANLKTGF